MDWDDDIDHKLRARVWQALIVILVVWWAGVLWGLS